MHIYTNLDNSVHNTVTLVSTQKKVWQFWSIKNLLVFLFWWLLNMGLRLLLLFLLLRLLLLLMLLLLLLMMFSLPLPISLLLPCLSLFVLSLPSLQHLPLRLGVSLETDCYTLLLQLYMYTSKCVHIGWDNMHARFFPLILYKSITLQHTYIHNVTYTDK